MHPHSALQQILVDALQALDEGLEGGGAHTVQNLLVALLGHNALLGVALTVAEAEQLLEAVLEVQLAAPAEALGKGHGNGVAVVDMGKGVGIHRSSTWPQITPGKLFSASMAPSPVPQPVTT